MYPIQIDLKKAVKKWTPILEKVGIKDSDKVEWMAEYAEYHQMSNVGRINESGLAYANAANVAGMGAVLATPAPTSIGVPGTAGSDLASSLLPVAMKIAAQTIGLDLVASKPSPGPVIDLPYLDIRYDDTPTNSDEKPQVFKVNCTNLASVKTFLKTAVTAAAAILSMGGVSKRLWFHISTSTSNDYGSAYTTTTEPSGSKAGWLEFLGFSFIDGLPMFRSYTQANTASSGGWTFDATKNTFANTDTIVSFLNSASLELAADGIYTNGQAFGTVTSSDVQLVSAFEDHLPGFVSNWNRTAMPRDEDDTTYPGVLGASYSVKRVAVGSAEVSAAARRTEIEDIKAQTGIDIIQKLEASLVNEMSQKISKEIVQKLFDQGDKTRAIAPVVTNAPANITDATIFDFDVTDYLNGIAPGGETSHAVQRKLISKMRNASHFLAVKGRIGPGQFAITNHSLAAVIADIAGYQINPTDAKMNAAGQLYPAGTVAGLTLYVDPYMDATDGRILIGRKNKPDQPGIIFVPYLMAQQISIISEATRAPRMFLRSRYAIAEVGFFPYLHYITMKVYDADNALI